MELCGGVLGLGLPLEVYSYQQKVNLKIVPVNLLFPINEILNPPETVTSQHPNRGKKIPAFIIKVTKRTFDE
jgi:hypothetical protein